MRTILGYLFIAYCALLIPIVLCNQQQQQQLQAVRCWCFVMMVVCFVTVFILIRWRFVYIITVRNSVIRLKKFVKLAALWCWLVLSCASFLLCPLLRQLCYSVQRNSEWACLWAWFEFMSLLFRTRRLRRNWRILRVRNTDETCSPDLWLVMDCITPIRWQYVLSLRRHCKNRNSIDRRLWVTPRVVHTMTVYN